MELREVSYLRPLGVPGDPPPLVHWEHICLCGSPGLWREMLEGKWQAGQAAPLTLALSPDQASPSYTLAQALVLDPRAGTVSFLRDSQMGSRGQSQAMESNWVQRMSLGYA